jgi:hypothetical protein
LNLNASHARRDVLTQEPSFKRSSKGVVPAGVESPMGGGQSGFPYVTVICLIVGVSPYAFELIHNQMMSE